MHRGILMAVVALGVVTMSTLCLAVSMTELGVQLMLWHDPLETDGRVPLRVSMGFYGKLQLDQRWMLRVAAGSPLAEWAPYGSLASLHALGARWVAEAELFAQHTGTVTQIGITAGARYAAFWTGSARVMVSSFPVGFLALHLPTGWTSAPLFAANVGVDVAWALSDRWVLGQTLGVTLVGRPGLSSAMAVPLADEYGLLVRSVSHVGFRP
jgi:hypothetical protein